ncbi:hypothetical protein HDV03_002209, partial [Kappamyces sp. JEL0829]
VPVTQKPIMVLCSFVYLCFEPLQPLLLNEGEIHSVYWVPISHLVSTSVPWRPVYFDTWLPPVRPSLRYYIALLPFSARNLYGIDIDDRFLHCIPGSEKRQVVRQFPLWGLTLWMTSDFLFACGFRRIFIRHSATVHIWVPLLVLLAASCLFFML